MIKRILAYLLLILGTVCLFFLYVDEIIVIALVMEVLYFIIGMMQIILGKLFVDIRMNEINPVSEKNQDMPVIFTVSNRGIFSFVNFWLVIKVENRLSGETRRFKVRGKSFQKGESEILIHVKCKEFGHSIITFERYFTFDQLFIFKLKNKVNQSQSVLIYPELNMISVEISQYTRRFIADSDEYSQRESGDDPTETYQIREYRQQDSIHDIHWKLSAKVDKLLVKERGKPVGYAVLIWIDMLQHKKQENRLLKTIELASALSFSMMQEECNHQVAWYDFKSGEIICYRIHSIEKIYIMLRELLLSETYIDSEEAEFKFKEKLEREHFSTVIKLYSDGKIMVGDKGFQIPVSKNEIQWDKIYFGV